jgi:hypothetical protein
MTGSSALRVVALAYACLGVLFTIFAAFATYDYLWWRFFRPRGSIGQPISLPRLMGEAAGATFLCVLAWVVMRYPRLGDRARLLVIGISGLLAVWCARGVFGLSHSRLTGEALAITLVLAWTFTLVYVGGTCVLWRLRDEKMNL